MGNSTTALWIYKKNDGNDNYLKIFGAEYPNDIKPNGNLFNKGLLDIDAIYNAGNFDPGVIETYRFNGKKYKLFKKRTNQ
jgi:hypothetical protein